MEKYLNRDLVINSFYNDFIVAMQKLDDDNEDKYALMCGWKNRANQYDRFEKLTQIGIKSGDKVLDIGCGVGEYVNYLTNKKLKVDYTGIDINQIYVLIAKKRYPNNVFMLSDGWDLDDNQFDWAVASGVFTIEANIVFMLWYVGFVMQKLVNKGFAFNLLLKSPHYTLANYDPDEVYNILAERFQNYKIEIVQGYLDDDFTIYVKK